jgi:hypothetical protein
MKLIILILLIAGCSSTPNYKKAIDECRKIRSEEGYDFLGYDDVSEFHKGKQEGLAAGYFYGCVDSRIRGGK